MMSINHEKTRNIVYSTRNKSTSRPDYRKKEARTFSKHMQIFLTFHRERLRKNKTSHPSFLSDVDRKFSSRYGAPISSTGELGQGENHDGGLDG